MNTWDERDDNGEWRGFRRIAEFHSADRPELPGRLVRTPCRLENLRNSRTGVPRYAFGQSSIIAAILSRIDVVLRVRYRKIKVRPFTVYAVVYIFAGVNMGELIAAFVE